ncbi:hypothetical protein Bhyg_02569, partial [Pseudolycoriella hygida]
QQKCLRFWFTFWLFAISVNNSVCSPVGILIVDNKNVSDLNIAESNQDDTVVSERDNEVGFLRKSDEKGADAYQHFESFHDKDGDAYGYEKHEAYGKSNKDESLNDEKDKSEGSHYNYVQELGDKAKYQKYHGSNDDPGKNKQNNYHYSYNSDDDVETKPNYSSKYNNGQKIEEDDYDEEDKDGNTGRIKDAVELHQPTIPRPTKPAVLVKEHRVAYEVFDDVPKSKPSKAPVVVHSSQPIVNVQQHYAGYHVEDSDGDKGSDDSGKGHAGSVSKHLYEIYVTHNTGKSNGGGGGGSGGDDAKGGDEGGDDSGKSGNLVLAQPENSNIKADENDNGTYKVNINYGNKNGLKKKIYRKRKGNLKKKRIIKPHKYEVEEYVENDEVKKQPLVAGKEASPSHHRDSEDYSNGQQFIYASEADSDAYYW